MECETAVTTQNSIDVLAKHFARHDKLRFEKEPKPDENREERLARKRSEESLPATPYQGAHAEGFYNLLRTICCMGEESKGFRYEVHNGSSLHILITNPELVRTVSLHAVESSATGKYAAKIYLHDEEKTSEYEFPFSAPKKVYRARSRTFVKDALEHLLE